MRQLADGCERNHFCKALHSSSGGPGPAGQKLLIPVGIPPGLASWDGMGIAQLSTSQDGRAPLPAVFQARPSISNAVVTTRSGSKPNLCCSSLSGAEAPKVFMPMMRPAAPT